MRKTIAAPLALLLTTVAAQAQGEAILLDDVIVSAGRIPVDAQSYARANSVLTSDDLERRAVADVPEALRQLPGVHVSRTGSAGGLTAVRIRGSEDNHVLVLIDGVEVPNASSGFDLGALAPEQIERIEVLRGPQSALYGAGATAGVISITTRGGIRNAVQGSLTVEGGTNPSRAVSGILQLGGARSDAALSMSYRNDEGYDSSGSDGERDGIENLTLNFKGSLDVTDTLRIRGSARFTDRLGEFDDTAFGCGDLDCYVTDGPGEIDGQDLFFGLRADWEPIAGRLQITPRASYARNENDVVAAFGPSSNDASTLKIDPQVALYFGDASQHAVIGLAEFKRQTFRSSFAGDDEKTRESYGVALDYQGDVTDRLFLQGGVRFDSNEDFEDALAWSASASYAFPETGTTLRASVAQGQTNPTFFEQFGFIPGEFTGNPDLKPERNLGWDIGVEQAFWNARAIAGLTYFNETLQDEIAGFGTTVVNLDGETEKQGVEASLTVTPVTNLSITASYTYLDTSEPGGLSEVRRPRHSGGVNLSYAFLEGRARLGASLTYFGKHRQRDFSDASFLSPSVRADEYFTVDLNGSYQVTDRIELFGTVKNLLDEDYDEVLGYAGQPLAAYLGLRASF